jgi:hypothetical protein
MLIVVLTEERPRYPADCSGDGPRDVVTNAEDAVDLPVIPLGPEMASRARVDQLRRDAHVLIDAL